MSQEASVLDLFNEFKESGGGGGAPFRPADTYTIEVTRTYVHKPHSLAVSGRIQEGPFAGQPIDLGFILNLKSEGASKRTFIILRQFGVPDEYLQAAGAQAGTDKEKFLDLVAPALMGRVITAEVVRDSYAFDNLSEEKNTLADRAKIKLVSAPGLPAIGGIPAAAPAAAAVAAPPPAAPVATAPVTAPAAAPEAVAAPVAAAAVPEPVAAAEPVAAVPVAVPPPVAAPVAVAVAAPVAAEPVAAVAVEAPAVAAPVAAAAVTTDEEPGF